MIGDWDIEGLDGTLHWAIEGAILGPRSVGDMVVRIWWRIGTM